MVLKDIKVTKEELDIMKKNSERKGTESYIYQKDSKTIFKIFKTESPSVLDNKFQKIILLFKRNIDFMINPIATLSCEGNFVGYQMFFLENCEWYQFPLCTYYFKELKDDLLILEDYGILYGDVWNENLFLFDGKLFLGDSDNIQIDGYPMDMLPYELNDFYTENRFTIDVHAFEHNLFFLEEMEDIRFTRDNIKELDKIDFSYFDEEGKKLIKDMPKVYQNPAIIKNRYLIDNLR